MKDYLNKENMFNSHKFGGVDENSLLYTYQFLLKKNDLKYKSIIERAIISRQDEHRLGVFYQYPELKNSHEDYMSHDQLTTIANFSYKYGYTWHTNIWKEIQDQGYRYDNLNPRNPKRFLHPRDIIYYAYLANHWIGILFFPLLALIMIQSTLSTKKVRPALYDRIKLKLSGKTYIKQIYFKTDGQLLNFTRINSCDKLGMKLLGKLINFLVKKKYGSWDYIYKIYYPKDHPIVL